MATLITISTDQKTKNLIKEKHLSPSECFRAGVKAMLNEPMPEFQGEKIEVESALAIKERQCRALQEALINATDDLEKERALK